MDGKIKKIRDTSDVSNDRLQPILPKYDFIPRFDFLLDMGNPIQRKLTHAPEVKTVPKLVNIVTPKSKSVEYKSPKQVTSIIPFNSVASNSLETLNKPFSNQRQTTYNELVGNKSDIKYQKEQPRNGPIVIRETGLPPEFARETVYKPLVERVETPLPPPILPQAPNYVSNSSGSQSGFQPLPQGTEYVDRTTRSVNYPTDVKKHYINIDTRYRPNILSTTSSNFRWSMSRPIKNCTSIRVASIEIPNNFYAFSKQKENITFYVKLSANPTYTELTISEGNYLPAEFENEINTKLLTVDPNFSAYMNLVTGKLEIENQVNSFDIKFPTNNMPTCWGIGYNMGFTQTEYLNQTILKPERIIDLVGDLYIFLQIGDYVGIQHEQPNRNILSATAKIVVTVEKYSILFDNGSNFISKEVSFPLPINISSFDVRLFDTNGRFIDLLDTNYSFTVEITEIVNSRLYSSYNDHLLQNNDTTR